MSTMATWPVSLRETQSKCAAPRQLGRSGIRALTRLHEAILGRSTLAIADQLEESQWLSSGIHRARQLERLCGLIDHARVHSLFYRRLLSHAPINSLDDLAQLPLLTRSILRTNHGDMAWRDAPGKILVGHTHGTFDEPVQFLWNRNRQAWDKANRLRGHGWHGYQIGDRELHVWPVDPPKALGARARQWLRERRDSVMAESQIDVLSPSHPSPSHFLKSCGSFNPARITAYPSALCELLHSAQRHGLRVINPSLRHVFLTGEVTFDWQRRLIGSMLHAPVVQSYGLQEAGALAFACEYGSWHVSAESAIIEIVREGRAARPGELGEIVVTGLFSEAMPMIRYCTGDIVRATEQAECLCGRGLPVMPPVIGRAGDFLMTERGEWLSPAEVVQAMDDLLGSGQYQVLQDVRGDLTVRLATAQGGDGSLRDRVIDRMKDLLGARRCDVRWVSTLTRTLFGKCRYITSDLTAGGLASR